MSEPTTKVERRYNEPTKTMADGALNYIATLDNEDIKRKAKEASQAFESMGKSAQQEGKKIDEAFKKIGTYVAGFFTLKSALDFGKQIVKVRGEIESLEVSFKTLLGDEEKAVKLMADIRKFAANTPMQMNDLAAGAKTLLAFNIEAERVMPILQALGDISMGDSQKFQGLTLAFSQMSSAGRLMGQDLMQMINAGFNPLAQISEKTGKSIGQLKEEMSAGKISVEMVTEAFMDATSEGGKFYGMLEKQSKGIQGSLSNVQGALQDMMNDLGEKLQEPVTNTLQGLQSLIQNYEKVGKVLAGLVATYGGYKAAVIATVAAEKVAQRVELQLALAKLEGIAITRKQALATIFQKDATLLLTKAQKLLNATMLKSPFVLAATAVVGLVSAYFLLRKRTDEAKLAQEQYDAVVKGQESSTQTRKEALDTIIQKIKDETATVYERTEAYKAFAEQFPELFKQYKETGELTDEMRVKIDALIADQGNLNEEIEKQGTADLQNSLQVLEAEYAKIIRLREKWKNSNNGSAISAEAMEYNEAWRKYQEQAKEAGFGNDDRAAVAYLKSQIDAQEKYLKERLDNIRKAEWAAKPITAKIEITQESIDFAEKELEDVKKKAEAEPWNPKVQLDLSIAEKQVEWLKNQLFAFQGEQASIKVRDLTTILSEIHQAEKALTLARTAAKGNSTESSRKDVEDAKESLDKLKKEYELVTGKSYDQVVKSGKDRLKARKEANAALKEAEDEFAKWQVKQAQKAEFDRWQADIDAMKEGLPKTLEQLNLNYAQQRAAIKENEEQMVEELRKLKEAEWNATHQEEKKNGMEFDRTTVTAEDLSNEQIAQLKQQEKIAVEGLQQAIEKANKEALDDVRTFEEKRLQIQEEYVQKRKEIELAGGTRANIEEANKQEEEALAALDAEIASQSEDYQIWLNSISSMTVRGLEQMLETAHQVLEDMKKMPGVDEEAIARQRQRISDLEQEIKSANLSPAEKDLEVWQKYGSEIGKLGNEISNLGDVVGGVVGESISKIGGIFSGVVSAIDGIKQYAVVSTKTIEGVSAAAATAIRTVEKASVILAIASAALTVLQMIDEFTETSGLDKWLNDVFNKGKLSEGEIEKARLERVEDLQQAYEDLQDAVDKAYGSSKVELLREQEENLRQQIEAYNELLQEENWKKNPDDDTVRQYQKEIDRCKKELEALKQDEQDAIFGSDIQSAIESLSDALVDVWAKGSTAAEAFKDFARKQTKELLTEMVKEYVSRLGYAEQIRKRLEEANSNGNISPAEWESIYAYAEQSGKEIEEALRPIIERIHQLGEEEERRAGTKGIAQASQESVNELNGRFTAIQGHTYTLSETTKNIASTNARMLTACNDILGTVRSIDRTTMTMDVRLAAMADDMQFVRRTMSGLEINGIRLKR